MENKDFSEEKVTVGLEEQEIEELNNSENIENTEEKTLVQIVYEWIDSFVISLVAVVLIFTFFLGKVRVDGESMTNTLQNDDQLIVSDFNYEPKYGDIVIISRNPKNYAFKYQEEVQEPIVKRVIAVGGDTIEITPDGKVLVNDIELDEPYIKDYALNLGTPQEHLVSKLEVPEGRVFVMGDNRHNSHDSRKNDIWLVDERYILGKVLLRIYPFEDIKTFN